MFLLFFLLGSERVPATSACLSSIKELYPGSDSAIIVVVSPLKALIKDQASCIVVFLSNLFYSAPNVTGISTLQ